MFGWFWIFHAEYSARALTNIVPKILTVFLHKKIAETKDSSAFYLLEILTPLKRRLDHTCLSELHFFINVPKQTRGPIKYFSHFEHYFFIQICFFNTRKTHRNKRKKSHWQQYNFIYSLTTIVIEGIHSRVNCFDALVPCPHIQCFIAFCFAFAIHVRAKIPRNHSIPRNCFCYTKIAPR